MTSILLSNGYHLAAAREDQLAEPLAPLPIFGFRFAHSHYCDLPFASSVRSTYSFRILSAEDGVGPREFRERYYGCVSITERSDVEIASGKKIESLKTAFAEIMFGAPWICRRCLNSSLKPGRRRLLRYASACMCSLPCILHLLTYCSSKQCLYFTSTARAST